MRSNYRVIAEWSKVEYRLNIRVFLDIPRRDNSRTYLTRNVQNQIPCMQFVGVLFIETKVKFAAIQFNSKARVEMALRKRFLKHSEEF